MSERHEEARIQRLWATYLSPKKKAMDASWLGLVGHGLFALPYVCCASNSAPGFLAEIEHSMNQVMSMRMSRPAA